MVMTNEEHKMLLTFTAWMSNQPQTEVFLISNRNIAKHTHLHGYEVKKTIVTINTNEVTPALYKALNYNALPCLW